VILDGVSKKLELILGVVEAGYVLIIHVLTGWNVERSSANDGVHSLGP
jgi:hypothetical protein